MSNAHTKHDTALNYMKEVLGPWTRCPKRSCKGTLTEVIVKYDWAEKPVREMECTTCGKVVKNPADLPKRKRDGRKYRFKGKNRWPSGKKRGYNKKREGNNASSRRR